MKTKQFYNTISPLYFIVDFFLSNHKKHLIKAVNQYPTATILEIGIGHGKHLKHFNSNRITGIDNSEKMLARAKANNHHSVILKLLDATEVESLNRQFDIVILSHILSTSNQPNKILLAASSVLNKGGKLIIINHFNSHSLHGFLEKTFQPIAKVFHFKSYFPLENLTALKTFRPLKALKFGTLNSYKLLIFEKT